MSRPTRQIVVDPENPDASAIDEAARVLLSGGLVAFPTETVYGLGADATDPAAVTRIFEAKGRPPTNPLIVHVDRPESARACAANGAFDGPIARLCDRWWPGPVTFVVRKSSLIPDVVTAGEPTVGLRSPSAPVALALIRALGRPIAAPSANRSTGLSPTRANHVLKDLEGRVDLILDGGPTTVGIESTVFDLTVFPPRVLRPGPVTLDRLLAEGLHDLQCGIPSTSDPASHPTPSPGQLRIHYAPRTPTFWVDPADFSRFVMAGRGGILRFGELVDSDDHRFGRSERLATPEVAALRLYEVLHDLDDAGLDFLVVVPPPDRPDWEAVRDRLWRASRPALMS